MANLPAARLLVCAGQLGRVTELRRLLQATGQDALGHVVGAGPLDLPRDLRLVVVEAVGCASAAVALCRTIRDRLEEEIVPILFITDNAHPEARLAAFDAGADACLLYPFAHGELLAQLRALLRLKEIHDRLLEQTAEVQRINHRLRRAHEQMDQELQLAQRLQSSFLPQSLPEVPGVRFAVHYLLCGRVGGDFYDLFRLDEQHLGLYVADAMGHGVPASLLTIFVKKGVRAKEVFGNQYRLVPPDEVLRRLNQEMIDQQLSESPFITMVYALLNFHTGELTLSRAGHPYPLHIPRHGEPSFWKQEGLLLGVLDAQFPSRTFQLAPGDKVLLYSDGIDTAQFRDCPAGADSLIACASEHRALPADAFVRRLAEDLFGGTAQPDDLTLLVLERTG
jgi:sigma-B regulation protein RsbU (phosphoserine phosphatase)